MEKADYAWIITDDGYITVRCSDGNVRTNIKYTGTTVVVGHENNHFYIIQPNTRYRTISIDVVDEDGKRVSDYFFRNMEENGYLPDDWVDYSPWKVFDMVSDLITYP